MQDYRLFLTLKGRIRASEEFLAEDDRAATEQAEVLRHGGSAELWNRSRMVRSFEVTDEAERGRAFDWAAGITGLALRA
jgi:hypothetical protein